jgi:hypothetical protein
VAAIKELLDRSYGRAVQPIEGSVTYGVSEQLAELFRENSPMRAEREGDLKSFAMGSNADGRDDDVSHAVKRLLPRRQGHRSAHDAGLPRPPRSQAHGARHTSCWASARGAVAIVDKDGGVCAGVQCLRFARVEKARLPARHLKRADQVRMKPSTSVSAQSSVFSIGSPCMWRTVILVMVPWVKICAAIFGGAGDPAIDGRAWLCGFG